jgi:type III pantothenate kinase
LSANSQYLALDAGNTRIKFGLFEVQPDRPLPVCLSHSFVMCGQPLPAKLIDDASKQGVPRPIISGSNPPEIARVADEWDPRWPALKLLEDRTRLGIRIDVEAPQRVGWDRLLNAIAALRIREPRQAAVIVDSGTAVTVDFVDAAGAFRGGAILPGIGMSARALHQYTALLPLIPAPDVTATIPDPIGRNTIPAMRSGLYWGHVGAVRELVTRMVAQAPGAMVIVTGGAGDAVIPHLQNVRVEPHLPLQGLVLATANCEASGAA